MSKNKIFLKEMITEESSFSVNLLGTVQKFLTQLGLVLSKDKVAKAASIVSKDPKIKRITQEMDKLDSELRMSIASRAKSDPEFQKILNAVKSKTTDEEPENPNIAANKDLEDSAVASLVKLGYAKSDAARAVSTVRKTSNYSTISDTLKGALKLLKNK